MTQMVVIPEQFHIYQTQHWLINHRIDTALPGYLMLGSVAAANDLSDLPDTAIVELGPLLANAQRTMRTVLKPARVYIGRFGHSPGYPVHFHLIPIYGWVERLFWSDPRYRALETFGNHGEGKATDGAELTLYVWREFCESTEPPPVEGPSVLQAVAKLREEMLGLDL